MSFLPHLALALATWFFGVLSPDGVKILFGYVDQETCKEERVVILDAVKGHTGWLVSDCFNPDKKV